MQRTEWLETKSHNEYKHKTFREKDVWQIRMDEEEYVDLFTHSREAYIHDLMRHMGLPLYATQQATFQYVSRLGRISNYLQPVARSRPVSL